MRGALRAQKPTFPLRCATKDFQGQSAPVKITLSRLRSIYQQLGLFDEAKSFTTTLEARPHGDTDPMTDRLLFWEVPGGLGDDCGASRNQFKKFG
jgi:hypothetical protein